MIKMCGITGIFGNADPSLALTMTSRLNHRGPDGISIYHDDFQNGSISLGHSRLSIIDIHGSKQPIESDQRSVLIQNGEIYNFKKIKSTIPNYAWRSNGDSEVILALHNKSNPSTNTPISKHIGKKSNKIRHISNFNTENNHARKHIKWVSKLDGIFSFSIWNPNNSELILCRDPMGVKPLFRTILDDGTMMFASEIKAFAAHPDFITKPDLAALHARLSYEYSVDMTTLFEGVTQISPGTIETWSIDEEGFAVLTGVSRYSKDIISPDLTWDPKNQSKPLLESLTSSIRDRLLSDVPVGIVLSGGLDSSLIASLASEAAIETSNPVPQCWTIAGSEDNPDYIAAQLVASESDLKLNSSIMEEDIFWSGLSQFAWHGEELDVSVLFWQPLFEHMSKKVKVGLCGQGADELHAGYSRYKNLNRHSKLIKNRLELLDKNLLPDIKTGPGHPWKDELILSGNYYNSVNQTLQFELDRGQLSNFQLRLADRHSMEFGMEVRVPFLGKAHREESHKIPMNWKISDHDEKMALRHAARHTNLPKQIIERPKLPAGTATAPNLFSSFIHEISNHSKEWINEYGILSKHLEKQPEMAIGIRLFHALHITPHDNPPINKNLLDLLDDVGDWNI